jgi:dihydroxyacetone kinase-like predicted kinase
VPPVLDADLIRAWARASVDVLAQHRAAVDRINVFPVADADTGTNLLLTMRSAVEAAEDSSAVEAGTVAAALSRGALLGARGNSGVILSQVLRGLAEAVAAAPDGEAAAVFADALARGVALAAEALVDPREGTALTVLAAAAAAADPSRRLSAIASARSAAVSSPVHVASNPAGIAVGAEGGGTAPLAAAVTAAVDAAALAVRATTAQLPELARAGVVDSGGLGVYLLLDALAGLVAGRLPVALPIPRARDRPTLTARRETGSAEYDYEVMFLLDAAPDAVDGLRARLAELGDSVAVVGDGGDLWNVHLHCNDVGAAIEAGIDAGRPHHVTVVRFADQPTPGRFARPRAVLMVVAGEELARLAAASGAAVLSRNGDEPVAEKDLVEALAATMARRVVLLPGEPDVLPVAESAAAAARREGQDVLVLPTASVLQSLSALAVHDPLRRPGEDVVAMAEAAAGTRTAALLVAETEALTWVGRCEPGDVLGIVDGEVVVIAPDLSVGALWLAHRMLLGGGEIVTALLGAGTDAALADGLAADLYRTHPEVDVVVYRGGQSEYPLVLGVE